MVNTRGHTQVIKETDRILGGDIARRTLDKGTVAQAAGGDEAERCRSVWQRKFGELPQSPEARAKQQRFLQYRGFSSEAIRRVLRGVEQ